MSGWMVRGTTNDVTHCEICGKVELRGTVHLVTEDGDEIFAGTTCAARKVGSTAAKIRDAVKGAAAKAEIIEWEFRKQFVAKWGYRPTVAGRMAAKGDDEATATAVVERMRAHWMKRNGFAA